MAQNNIISTLACAGSYKVAGEVGGVTVSLLVDTGSPVTLLSSKMWDKIVGSPVLKPWQGQQFVGVTGSPLLIRGCSQVKIRLAKQESFQHQVLVIDSLMSEGILGLDFLQEHNCTINLSHQLLEVPSGGSKIPLESTHKVRHPVDVELLHAVSVPARSELDILVKTRVHVEDGGTWLMEGPGLVELQAKIFGSPSCGESAQRYSGRTTP